MKLFSLILLASAVISLSSCEVTREITLNQDGSGKLSNTIDMSSLIGIAKMSGQAGDLDKKMPKNIDTVIALSSMADSITNLSAEEKTLLKTGTLNFKLNPADEKFVATTLFPFKDPSQLQKLGSVAGKAIQETMKKQMNKGDAAGSMPDGEMPTGSVDDYYDVTYTTSVIEKKLNATKYATVGDDKGMQSLKEIAGQGLPLSTTVIINLPRPAKKTTGKNVKLSEDKKKVTISEPMDQFFDDGKNLEFRIEY